MRHSFHQNFLINSLVFSNLLIFASWDYNSTNCQNFPRFLTEIWKYSTKDNGRFVKSQSPEAKSSGFERTDEFVKKILWNNYLIQLCTESTLAVQFSCETKNLIWT